MSILIGFIGQGWIGKNYADDFERREYETVRFALEEPYAANGPAIAECDIVFIAVPTPTTPDGFDDSIVRSVMRYIGPGKTAVIKSTILPGTTKAIQAENPGIYVLHSPEFLTESSAAHDAAHPRRNIVGIPEDTPEHRRRAQKVLDVLPLAGFELICSSTEAEIIKYARNVVGFMRVVFANLLYDLAQKAGADWKPIFMAISADPDNGPVYMNPLHKGKRGAGGHCFIKDFRAFADLYASMFPDDSYGIGMFNNLELKNNALLLESRKDLDLLASVYGDEIVNVADAANGS